MNGMNAMNQGNKPMIPNSILKHIPEPLQGLFENPFFSAGFGLIGVGSILAIGRKGFQQSLIQARRYFFVSVEVPSKDKSYLWLMEWLSTKKSTSTRHVSVETTYSQHESGEIHTKVNFIPSVGTHYVYYRGRVIKVERSREKNIVDMSSGNLWESITLTTLGTSRQIFQKLIEEAKVMALDKEEGRTLIYSSMGTEWRRFGHPRKRRPIGTVVLDRGLSDLICQDVKKFLGNSQWYTERGIPYRRGYLLYGPPGTGKSSFITALAGELQLSICILNLAGKNISDNTLNQLLSSAPQRSIILLEDIDSAIQTGNGGGGGPTSPGSSDRSISNVMQYQGYSGTGLQNSGNSGQLTFSGLLNALDGVAASEGRILFMTTNHLEKLDKVLIRPGRVDLQVPIGLSTNYQMENIFLKFYPKQETLAKNFVERLPEHQISPAQLQAYFMQYSDDPHKAVNNSQELIH